MFPASSSADLLGHQSPYDFNSGENEGKWQGIFVGGLKKVMFQVGHTMKAKEDALDYLEKLIIQLLGMICSRPSPHSVQEVQDRVHKLFPTPIDEWVIDVAATAIKQGKRKLVFPVEKIHPLLKEALQHKIDQNVTYYICAILEYIANDMLTHVVLKYVKLSRHGEFSTQDIRAAICYDKVFCDLFKLGDTFSVAEEPDDEPVARNSLTYSEVVEDYMQWEKQYLRDLQMLLKVFREQLADKLEQENEDLELVFQTLEDIAELTISLISQVEDVTEMTDSNQTPLVGICFLELAEDSEFDVYDRYVECFNDKCRKDLERLLCRPDIGMTVSTAGHGFVEAVKFYFPKLLLEPFYHGRQYFDYISLLSKLTSCPKDKNDFEQALSVLTRIRSIESVKIPCRTLNDIPMRIAGKGNKEVATQKFVEMKSMVEGFDDSLGQSYFNEFICEDNFLKLSSGRKPSERHAYLFDAFICLCKPNYRRTSVVTGGTQFDYRLKEYYYLTKVEVRDKDDTEEWKNQFELVPRHQPPVVLAARSYEEKSNWMGALVMLTTKSMLDRILDRILSDEEKKHPLRLPPVEKYKFAVEDSDDNIIFDKDNGNHFLIKGATLIKLVERLTHHQYFDPNFINTFLTTYRSFCSPHEFLTLLEERFNIPDPELPYEDRSIHTREMMKRFRKEYCRHVKLRVLNVMKQWVLHHFYDFERDPTLQARLEEFLDNADESKRSIFESVKKCLRKAVENSNNEQERMYPAVKSPPPIEYHIRCPQHEWNILTLHPIELARQLTLLEFDYYRAVKPSELVGSVWTKKNKEQLSPNLLKMIKHTTNVTRWFVKTIVDAENIEERIAIVSRILEVMMVMQELNNFNGVLAVVSAMGSASVHRLQLTWQGISPKLQKALEDAQDLQNDHYKRYQEKLRSINPPCVPFFGMYLTNILHIEEGNKDFLPNNTDLINFGKRRKVAEITSEIRQFQYSHYCFSVETHIREFIENIQPFAPDQSENAISDYLFNKSLEIEPRGAKAALKFPRKWPDLNLKSPGIKPRHLPGRNYPGPLLPFSPSASSYSLHTSSSRMTLDSELDCVLGNHTPTKTLTPSSNPSTTSPQDPPSWENAVFAPVYIGHPANQSPISLDSFSVHSQFFPPPNPTPPPLPPRRTRDGSLSDSVSPRQFNDEPPPPLPPRKVSPRTPNPPLPRRNSSSSTSEFGQSLSPSVNLPPHNIPPPISERLTNGPSSIPLHSPTNGGHTSCISEHHSEFVFPMPRYGPRPPVPMSPPKLPPKATKPVSLN